MKYIKLFEETSQYTAYTADTANFLKPNVSLCEDDLTKVYYNPYIPPAPPLSNNMIRYIASEKLPETTVYNSSGLHTNAFNTTIKSHTFANGVGTIEFDGDVTTIGQNAFRSSYNLTSIEIPSGVRTIGSSAFYICSGLTGNFIIPSGVTIINTYTFSSCGGLTSVTIPNTVTSIEQDAFSRCTSLTSVGLVGSGASVEIPSGVTSIGEQTFYNCKSLTSVTIPSGVTYIGDAAFESCSNLTSITCEATTPPYMEEKFIGDGYDTFDDTNDCPIYVPSGSVNTYKAATGWSTYASRIQAIQS